MKKRYNDNEPEKLSTESLKTIFDSTLFLTETEVEEQVPCILVKENEFNSTVASFGNIGTVVGKPKAGKTFVVTAIAAALLKNSDYLRFTGRLPDEKNKVLFIDTEQSKRDCKKVLQRISRMTGTPDKHPANLIYMRLRGKEPDLIIQVVEYAVNSIDGLGAVIIDGIKDLVYSINDEHEATKTASKLLDWSEKRGLHILTVIHQNKMDMNTRGHIGTELENKSETVITVEKDTRDKDLIIVKGKLMRDREFEPFAFRIIDGLPELSDTDIRPDNKKIKKPTDCDEQTHKNILSEIFPANNNCSQNELTRVVIETLKRFDINVSDKPARDFVKHYIDNGFIKNVSEGTKAKFVLNEQ